MPPPGRKERRKTETRRMHSDSLICLPFLSSTKHFSRLPKKTWVNFKPLNRTMRLLEGTFPTELSLASSQVSRSVTCHLIQIQIKKHGEPWRSTSRTMNLRALRMGVSYRQPRSAWMSLVLALYRRKHYSSSGSHLRLVKRDEICFPVLGGP